VWALGSGGPESVSPLPPGFFEKKKKIKVKKRSIPNIIPKIKIVYKNYFSILGICVEQ
jgi:hypothetical protein